jgi:hypothetical protein
MKLDADVVIMAELQRSVDHRVEAVLRRQPELNRHVSRALIDDDEQLAPRRGGLHPAVGRVIIFADLRGHEACDRALGPLGLGLRQDEIAVEDRLQTRRTRRVIEGRDVVDDDRESGRSAEADSDRADEPVLEHQTGNPETGRRAVQQKPLRAFVLAAHAPLEQDIGVDGLIVESVSNSTLSRIEEVGAGVS